MDRREFEDRRRIGTVKAAVNMYGERILEGSSSLKKPQMDFPELSSSRAKEVHMAKRDMVRYRESRKTAESVKSQAESELSSSEKTAKDLASQIQESNAKAKARMRDMEKMNKSSKRGDKALDDRGFDSSHQYAEMVRELEIVKQELSRLKLDMDSVLEEKRQAEKQIEASSSKLSSNLSSVEKLKKEIEDVNEEQVVVELAEIEALKEFGEIQAQREKESNEFSLENEKTREKIKGLMEDIEHSKELESKLSVTLTDVDVLQNELKVVKEIEKKVLRNDSMKHSSAGGSFRKSDESEGLASLSSITDELEEAKKELASIREEGFTFMASMDIIRNELRHVMEETAQLQKTEQKADLTVQNLNSKLLRAKTKLEAATAAEEQARTVLTNLSLTLEQLKTQAEAAKQEKELITAETANTKAEIEKTESDIGLTEEKLQVAMQELEGVKESEELALQNLQYLIENTIRTRASASQQSSSITISKFEYEYLTGRAVKAEEIADKKVAAAEAWVEALKASEKEILMKIEIAHREMQETKTEEEKHVYRTMRPLSSKRGMEREVRRSWRQKEDRNEEEAENFQRQSNQRKSMKTNGNSTPRKSMKNYGNSTPLKRGKVRTYSVSPAVRLSPGGSTLFTIRKKKKVMPDLARFFSGKRVRKNH